MQSYLFCYPKKYLQMNDSDIANIIKDLEKQYNVYKYSIIAKESFISASFDGINGWSHDLFWTETWANYLSQNYFGANSLINSWPSQNISWFNYLRLLSANIIIP